MNLHPSHHAHLERRHAVAMRNVDRLFHRQDARACRRCEYWVNLAIKLEKRLWHFPKPTPEEAAQFRAEQEGRA